VHERGKARPAGKKGRSKTEYGLLGGEEKGKERRKGREKNGWGQLVPQKRCDSETPKGQKDKVGSGGATQNRDKKIKKSLNRLQGTRRGRVHESNKWARLS